jgi:hypothetical protein
METNKNNNKLACEDWEPYFRRAKVRVEDLDACKSNRAKAIKIGRFLSPNVNRPVPIECAGRRGKAVLRMEERRAKGKYYFFEVIWEADKTTDKEASKNVRTKKAPTTAERKKVTKAKPANSTKVKSEAEVGPGRMQGRGNREKW